MRSKVASCGHSLLTLRPSCSVVAASHDVLHQLSWQRDLDGPTERGLDFSHSSVPISVVVVSPAACVAEVSQELEVQSWSPSRQSSSCNCFQTWLTTSSWFSWISES